MYPKIFLFLIIVLVSACQKKKSEENISIYKKKGKEIVMHTRDTLSSVLMSKMKEGGISNAIGFCNLRAISTTGTMEDRYDVTIKRTSSKFRNPNNKPTALEAEMLATFKSEINNGEVSKPRIRKDGDKSHYFSPILVEKKCLACHGKLDQELSAVTDSIIKSKYPNDLATGYSEGDLRGMWHVAFND